MRVGIEIRWVERGTSGGIVACLEGVLNALFRRHPQDRFHVYGTAFSNGLVEFGRPNVAVDVLPLRDTWPALQRNLARDDIDVLFRAYPTPDTLRFPLSKQVVFVPDLQHERFPEFFSAADLAHRRSAFARALAGAGAIGTLSAYTRHTIEASPAARCRDIFLMPPAVKDAATDTAAAPGALAALERRLDEIGPYLLFPANLWPHKNHARTIEALALARRRAGIRLALVLTGFADEWPALAARFPDQPVHHLGFVSEAELALLYRRAVALAFFSLYEGFGMPLLEAFRADCPVICSDTCSLPEVGGDAVLACDPTDVGAMAAAIERIGGDSALRDSLAAAGRRRLAHYSWERSADALAAALARVTAPKLTVAAGAPLVSIVTPSFNQGRFLRRTIDSVLAQTYPHIDYEVVDGASTDDSVAILRSYGDRIRWRSEPDKGQTHAINKGFAASRGGIRAYLNSDDTLLPDGVARAVAFLERHPACDLVYGTANYIDADDRITGHYDTADYSFARLMEDCCICQPAAFWRAEIAAAVGPFDETLDYAMDYDYWLRIGRAGGQLIHIPDRLANSRLHADAKTLTRRSAIYDEIFRICRRHGGYVSPTYYEGLWHHRLWERATPLSRLLRRIPDAHRRIARLHRAWFGKNGARSNSAAAAAGATMVPMAPSDASARRPAPGARVSGFWPDGWLARHASFGAARLKDQRLLFVTGSAASDCELSIRAGGETLEAVTLHGREVARVALPTPRSLPLELTFSAAAKDAEGREVAFKLLATNLFIEQDY